MHQGKRVRGVRLTPEARDQLTRRIDESFAESVRSGNGPKRLTREARAEMLGLSVRTADRILQGETVDRASLRLAFSAVGLAWEDRFAESPAPASGEPATSIRPSLERPRRWAVRLAVAIGLLLVGGTSVIPRLEPAMPNWHPPFAKDMAAATEAYHRADYAAAREHLERARPQARKFRDASAIAWVLRLDAEILAAQGDSESALKRVELALTYLEDLRIPDQFYGNLELAASYRAATGRLDEATEAYKCYLAWGERTGDRYIVAAAHRGLGSIADQRQAYAEAVVAYDRGLAALGEGFEVELAVDLRGRRALSLAYLGRHAEAIDGLNMGLRFWEARGHPRWVATSHLRLGRAYLAKGDRSSAQAHLTAALRGYERVGDQKGREKCEQLLAQRKPLP